MRLARRARNYLLQPIRSRIQGLVEHTLAARLARPDGPLAVSAARQDALATEIAALSSQHGALTAQHDALASRVGVLAAQLEAVRDELFAMQRLLTGTAAARPPGAVEAVPALGTPAVAVVIPTYNRPRFLPEAIASVQRQSFQGWELIIVGDGTDDRTQEAVRPFLSDPRIRFLRQDHAGNCVARNRGIAETTAPLVAYLDDDNLWYPDFLARAVDCMATNPEIDVLYGALVTYAHLLDRSCILWRPFDREALLAGNFIDTNTIVHRRHLVARYGGWDPAIRNLSDWYLMLRYTAEKPAHALDVLAACYRICDEARVSLQSSVQESEAEIRRRMAAGGATATLTPAR